MKVALVAIALLVANAHCQVQINGRFSHYTSISDVFRDANSKDILQRASYRLPKQDNFRFLRLALIEEDQGIQKPPYKFGQAIPFFLNAEEDGKWNEDKDKGVRTWRALVASQGASSISLNFDRFYLPPNSELYVVGVNETLGAFTGAINNKPDERFSTTPLQGDTVLLEYFEDLTAEPELEKGSSKLKLSIDSVVHGFRKGISQFRQSGSCNIDAACPQGSRLRNQIQSVGIFITDNGQRFCSGTLLNNGRQDGRQLFITANHCMTNIDNTSNYIVGFNYQNRACVSGGAPIPASAPRMQTVQGMRLLTRWDKSDFALFEILEPIPDSYKAFYAGWTRSSQPPSGTTGIHHPQGDVKKLSFYSGICRQTAWSEAPQTYHWMVDRWSSGVTEPGSSGSGLFNNGGRYVGHLHGGQSSCENKNGYDLYGALMADWGAASSNTNRLKQYLDPDNRGIIGMSGNYFVSNKVGTTPNRSVNKRPVGKVVIELED